MSDLRVLDEGVPLLRIEMAWGDNQPKMLEAPTLTPLALAARASDHLVERLKRGEL